MNLKNFKNMLTIKTLSVRNKKYQFGAEDIIIYLSIHNKQ